jgi:hypothetical protein
VVQHASSLDPLAQLSGPHPFESGERLKSPGELWSHDIRPLWQPYVAVSGLGLAVLGVWLFVGGTPNAWMLFAVLLGAGGLVVLWATLPKVVRGLLSWFRSAIKRALDIARLESEFEALARSNLEVERTLRAKPARERIYADGIDEGLRRARGLAATPRPSAMPRDLFAAVGEDEPTIVGQTPRLAEVTVGGRVTLVAIGTGRVIGVLEVAVVNDDGQVVMKCVDPVVSDYWDGLADRPTSGIRRLDGVTLIAYDPDKHHPDAEATPEPPLSNSEPLEDPRNGH